MQQGLKTLHSLGTALGEDRKLLSHSHREKKFSTANLRSVSLNNTDDDQMQALIPREKRVGKKSGVCSGREVISTAGRSLIKCNLSSTKKEEGNQTAAETEIQKHKIFTKIKLLFKPNL